MENKEETDSFYAKLDIAGEIHEMKFVSEGFITWANALRHMIGLLRCAGYVQNENFEKIEEIVEAEENRLTCHNDYDDYVDTEEDDCECKHTDEKVEDEQHEHTCCNNEQNS